MRTIAIIIALIVGLHATAQQWCSPGAKWSHDYQAINWSTGETHAGTKRAWYAGDTVIGGYPAQRIKQHLFYEVIGTGEQFSQDAEMVHTRYEGDVVYQWKPWAGQFDTLLWYGAFPGDKWSVWGFGDQDYYFLATDTATVTVDGIPLRRVVVSMMYIPFGQAPVGYDTLYERIGSSVYSSFEPPHPAADGINLSFRCYQDDDCSYPTPATVDCGFTLAIDEAAPLRLISVFPNPGHDRFWIAGPSQMNGTATIRVLDGRGAVLGMWRMNGGSVEVDATPWAADMYLIEWTDATHRLTSRWIKR